MATLVPHPLGLTALRVLGPAALALALLALVAGDASPAAGAAAVALGAVACVTIVSGATTDAFVDGASYGAERRFGLRVPAGLLLGPLPLAWAVVVVGAGGRAAAAGGGGMARGAGGAPRGLAAGRRRAAGPARPGPALGGVRAQRVRPGRPDRARRSRCCSPAPPSPTSGRRSGYRAVDLTAGALGLVVEVRLADAVALARRRGRHGAEDVAVHAFLMSPVRPGALLDAARGHRLPVS